MQKTRQAILDILRERGQATVEQLSQALDLTPVTIRHHIDILRDEDLIEAPKLQHRQSVGRPQHIYKLTPKGNHRYLDNYADFTNVTLLEMREQAGPEAIEALMQGVAKRMAIDLPARQPGESIADRLDRAVTFLNQKGYAACWESTLKGYVLHTANCPYSGLTQRQCCDPCVMDLALMTELLGVAPQRIDWLASGGEACSYLIATPDQV
jgi:predicted ArsR family transcriptional regulator